VVCLAVAPFLITGSYRTPFPGEIPIRHFSYFQYPTDVLGFMDAREGAEITPEGHIYTGYTELIFLHGTGFTYFPLRTHYWLEKEYLPVHHWEQTVDGIEYRFMAFAAPLDLNPERNLVVFIKITVGNRSNSKKNPLFALGTRYGCAESEGTGKYAPLRHRFRRPEKAIRVGMYEQEGEHFSSRWMFQFKDNSLLRHGKILYTFSGAVEPDYFSYKGYKTKPGKEFTQPPVASSPVGIVRFSKELNPGESFDISVKMPYTPVEPSSEAAREMAGLSFPAMKRQVVDFWEDLLARGMQVELPEEKPVCVYKTGLIYDLIARDKIGDDYVQKVNEFHYDAFWLRDSAYLVRSYDLGGYHDIARQSLEFFFRWQKEDGNFLSQGGQYDGWGQTLWALGQHYRLTGDKAFAEKSLQAIMKAAEWLNEQIKEDPLGIMPITTPGDNEAIEGGHVTGHNFWALAGLKNAIALAEGLSKSKEAHTLKALHKKLRRNVLKTLHKVLKATGKYIPPGLDKPGGQDWGNLMAVYPEEILGPHHPAVTETLKRSKAKYREKIMTYWNTRYLHHYLTMKNTETLVVRGDQQEVLDEFYAILAHTSSTQAGFEFSIDPWSNRDFRANLAPHGWFAAKYRNLLRSMLIRERGEVLHLLSVVSPAWAKAGDQVRVKNAPTYFGKVSFSARFNETGMDLELEPQFSRPPSAIAVHIPYFARFTGSTAGKLKRGALFFPHGQKKLSIQWKLKENAPFYSFEKMVQWLKEEYRKR
jgi:hypothetical protein